MGIGSIAVPVTIPQISIFRFRRFPLLLEMAAIPPHLIEAVEFSLMRLVLELPGRGALPRTQSQ